MSMTTPGRRLPTPDEARAGAVVAADNAEALLNAGGWLGMQHAFGHGAALLVLSLEEAVKARALMAAWRVSTMPGSRLGFTDEQLRKIIFRSHGLRHAAAFLQGLSGEGRTRVFGVEPMDDDGRKRLALEMATGEWLMKANELKERGIYTDFLPDGTWSSPADVAQDEFAHAVYIVKTFVDETLRQAANHRTAADANRPLPSEAAKD
jgi:AbiV family abortive infection protein